MVRVVVGAEGAADLHAIRVGDADEVVDAPGGVDDHTLPGVAIAEEVDEVLHAVGGLVGAGEVPATEARTVPAGSLSGMFAKSAGRPAGETYCQGPVSAGAENQRPEMTT